MSNAKEMSQALLSHDLLTQLLEYRRMDGALIWKVSPRFSVPAGFGERRGGLSDVRHMSIGILGKRYRIARLVWFYVTGEWPNGYIDHINGDPHDNRFENLRDCSPAINSQNQRKPHKNNRTGMLGVTKNGSKANPYRAQINLSGHIRYLGIFPTAERAHQAYVDAKRQLHAGCTI